MKISADLVGVSAGPLVHDVDARWLMAYAAALGDAPPEYLDTTRRGGIIGHPLFAVCCEWPLACELRARTMAEDVLVRGVHATHDLRLHRRVRAGDRLATTATILSVEPRRSGAYLLTRFETVDARGRPVSTTDYGSVYRDVACDDSVSSREPARASTVHEAGAARVADTSEPRQTPERREQIAIAPTLAHVYTECARIWNPIHTDRAVAQGAGLPDIILHGTATLALAISRILAREPAGAAAHVTRVACRFGGMVLMPSTIELVVRRETRADGDAVIAFDALGRDGRTVLRGGRIDIAAAQDGEETAR